MGNPDRIEVVCRWAVLALSCALVVSVCMAWAAAPVVA